MYFNATSMVEFVQKQVSFLSCCLDLEKGLCWSNGLKDGSKNMYCHSYSISLNLQSHLNHLNKKNMYFSIMMQSRCTPGKNPELVCFAS